MKKRLDKNLEKFLTENGLYQMYIELFLREKGHVVISEEEYENSVVTKGSGLCVYPPDTEEYLEQKVLISWTIKDIYGNIVGFHEA